MTHVITRVAPSPTGKLHFATARAALFNYLYAKQHNGKFILRLEDTDKARSTKEFADDIVEQLNWLGLTPDETHVQTEYTDAHVAELKRLIDADKAYVSEEPSKENPDQKVSVVRLRNPGTTVVFDDLIRGRIETDTTDLGDFVIARTIDDPLFHFVVVVDDERMGITHVIRGEDHIPNTPRQILIAQALGYSIPQYAHLPIILSPDGKGKMSKRKGDVAIASFRERGFLPEAIINYVALLGWHKDGETEFFTLQDLLRDFSLAGIQKGGAAHNEQKMLWFNKEHLKHVPDDIFLQNVVAHLPETLRVHADSFAKLLPDMRERISVWNEVTELAGTGEWDWILRAPVPNTELLPGKKSDAQTAKKHLQWLKTSLQDVPEEQWHPDTIKNTVWDYATEKGRGQVLWPLRFCLTGKEKSPDPFMVAYALGKTETLQRITSATDAL